jgi:hypothetical protein
MSWKLFGKSESRGGEKKVAPFAVFAWRTERVRMLVEIGHEIDEFLNGRNTGSFTVILKNSAR